MRYAGKKQVSIDATLLFRLWNSDLKNDEICERLQISRGYLWALSRRYGLGRRPHALRAPSRPMVDPTPEEIAERAAHVRSQWPAGEAERRFVGGGPVAWRIQRFAFDGRCCAFTGTGVDY